MENYKINEKFLYEIWRNQDFEKELFTEEKEKITVLDAGVLNNQFGGPDFKNARIIIGNITFLGDIEIDLSHSDWKSHGHFLNKKYNKVLLHVVLHNNSDEKSVTTQDGRKVQSVLLESFLKNSLHPDIQLAIRQEREKRLENNMPCSNLNSIVPVKEKLTFIFNLGIERFNKKREKMRQRLKELTYLSELQLKEPIIQYDLDERFIKRDFTSSDFSNKSIWHQLIHESIFEALGYTKNKDNMQRLAEAVNIEELEKYQNEDDFVSLTESFLFNAAGLAPDIKSLPENETSDYTKDISNRWQQIANQYNGRTFQTANWHFFKMRPQNFPTIRIAGGARLINRLLNENLVQQIITLFKSTNNPRKLSSELRTMFTVKAQGYWKKHFVFDQPSNVELKYFIGTSRADEIIINIILPIMSIYFEIFNKNDLAKKVLKLYLNYYQIGNNSIVYEVNDTLQLKDASKRTVFHQGMIEIFKEYCSKERCLECEIGKKVFN